MERELFDYDNWDNIDDFNKVFYGCVLKQDIGVYRAGEKFDSICVNYENGEMSFWIGDDEAASFQLELRVKA